MRKLMLVLLVILVAFNCYSQSLLYKVTGEKLTHPVYIYGTIHSLTQSDFFIDDYVLDALSKSDKLLMEIDMSNPNVLAEIQATIMMTNNSIDKIISASDYEVLNSFFADSLQMPLEYMKQMKPIMLSSLTIPKLVGPLPASYEGFFTQKAAELGKPISGLETVAEQMSYMDKISLKQQAKMLMESINDFPKARKEFKNLVESYKTRNVEDIYKLMMETSDEYREFGEYLINDRNKNWIPRIIEQGNKQVTFIAVGCGHLGGTNGILNLLKNEGLSVEMVEK
jgi:uncharacterized protein